jgi:hypothetical protein
MIRLITSPEDKNFAFFLTDKLVVLASLRRDITYKNKKIFFCRCMRNNPFSLSIMNIYLSLLAYAVSVALALSNNSFSPQPSLEPTPQPSCNPSTLVPTYEPSAKLIEVQWMHTDDDKCNNCDFYPLRQLSSDQSGRYAVVAQQYIHVSSDYGLSFEQTSAPAGSWSSLWMSSSGQRIAASVYQGGVHVSSDYGASWTQTSLPNREYVAVGMDDTGQYISTAVHWYYLSGGHIYTSHDSGSTWVQTDAPVKYWNAMANSRDGKYFASVAQNEAYNSGCIAVSSDYGITWRSVGPVANWWSLAIDPTGRYLAAVVRGGSIYLSSDYGLTWQQSNAAPIASWVSIVTVGKNERLVAGVFNGPIYLSNDAGATWTMTDAPADAQWGMITADVTGTYMIAYAAKYGIYVSNNGNMTTRSPVPAPTVSPSASPSASPTTYSPTLAPTRQAMLVPSTVVTFTGVETMFEVPLNVSALRIYMWGAGGYGSSAGAGAYVEGILKVTPGQKLSVIVGQAGNPTYPSFGGGGVGGGGRSAIRYAGSSVDLVTAGGGGGGTQGGSATAYDASTGQVQITSYRGGNVALSSQCGNNCLQNGKRCPENWELYGSSCYYYVSNKMWWTTAQDNCVYLGGWLVDIFSADENAFVAGLIKKQTNPGVAWIGMQRGWHWVTGKPVTYYNFAPGEPNNSGGDEDCVSMYLEGTWNDARCIINWAFYSVCKMDATMNCDEAENGGGGSNTTAGCNAENPLTPTCSGYSADYVCLTVNEWGELSFTAPEGFFVIEVVFASYGLPIDYQVNQNCHSAVSRTRIETSFLYKTSSKIGINNNVFGDPCGGKIKHISVMFRLEAAMGGGGGYKPGGRGSSNSQITGGGGAGSSHIVNLIDFTMSDAASLVPGVCAGAYSKYYPESRDSCGASEMNGFVAMDIVEIPLPTGVPTPHPTSLPSAQPISLSPFPTSLPSAQPTSPTKNHICQLNTCSASLSRNIYSASTFNSQSQKRAAAHLVSSTYRIINSTSLRDVQKK